MNTNELTRSIALKLAELIRKYPEMPIKVVVSSDVTGDDCDRWYLGGKIVDVRLDEIVECDYNGHVHWKSVEDIFNTLEDYYDNDNLPETTEECRPLYDKLPWETVIRVLVDLPQYWEGI